MPAVADRNRINRTVTSRERSRWTTYPEESGQPYMVSMPERIPAIPREALQSVVTVEKDSRDTPGILRNSAVKAVSRDESADDGIRNRELMAPVGIRRPVSVKRIDAKGTADVITKNDA